MTRLNHILKYIVFTVIFCLHVLFVFFLFNNSINVKINELDTKNMNEPEVTWVNQKNEEKNKENYDIQKLDNEKHNEKHVENKFEEITLQTETPSNQTIESKEMASSKDFEIPKKETGFESFPINTTLDKILSPNRSSVVSPSVFFRSFKEAYYKDQQSIPETTSRQNPCENSQELVKERLGEWKIADFMQKVKQAFHEAAKRTPGTYLNSEAKLSTNIDVNLEIQKNGTIKILKFESSGVQQVDEYIKRFINDVIVCPIPARFNVNAIPFPIKILINLDKNTRYYSIRCFC